MADLYARPGRGHYHLSKNCHMLDTGQFEHFGYKRVSDASIEKRKLRPCLACVGKLSLEQARNKKGGD